MSSDVDQINKIMENVLGLLRVHIIRGVNLAVRDVIHSDPYVLVRLGKQACRVRNWNSTVLTSPPLLHRTASALHHITRGVTNKVRTRFVKNDLNPEWNEKLTLCVTDPNIPLKLYVYDRDRFSFDDEMGCAEIDICPFIRAAGMKNWVGLPNGTIIEKVQPNRQNCLTEESCIISSDGKVVQNVIVRLRDVECGQVELQLQWIEVPAGSKKS